MAPIYLLLAVCGVFVALVLFVFAIRTKRVLFRNSVVGASLVLSVFYAASLLGCSLMSKPRTLALNEPKEFCGFYLDCHVHAKVTEVRRVKTIGEHTASGEFLIAKVKVFSDAKNTSIKLRLLEPQATIIDDSGAIYARNLDAESSLSTESGDLNRDVTTGQPFEKELVFDIPANAANPRLDIAEGYGIDKIIEAVLIDDEDSILHKRTFLSLSAAGSR
jgi:hypothetical protein